MGTDKKALLVFLNQIEEKHVKAEKEQKSYHSMGDGDATAWKFIGREEGYNEIVQQFKTDINLENIDENNLRGFLDYIEKQANKLSGEAQMSDGGGELQFCLAKAATFEDAKQILKQILQK